MTDPTSPTDTPVERRGFGSLRLRGRTWYIRYRVDGREHWENSHSTSRREAEKLLARRQAELGLGVLVAPNAARVGFADLETILRDHYRVKQRRSGRRLDSALKHLRAAFGGRRAMAITTDAVTRYEADRLDGGAARATVNYELSVLRRAFNLAVKAKRLPISAKPAISTADPHNARQGFFEEADFRAVLAELPEPLRPVMEFAYYTGWRPCDEILPLTWDRVDFGAGTIRLEPNTTKNDEGRMFPFDALPPLHELLDRQREHTTATEHRVGRIIPHVFHRGGRPIRSYDHAWRSACRRAAVKKLDGREIVVRPALLGRIVYDFRRTAVRNLERAGVPRSVAMKLTGHKTEAVYRRYAIAPEADLREGLTKLADLHASLGAPKGAKGTTGGQTGVIGAVGGKQ